MTPLFTKPLRLGLLAAVAILLLRLAIGWHFFREGADKLIAGDFTSVGFMKIATGPFVPVFRWMIWDGDGLARLDQKGTLAAWDQYRQRVVDHYGFDQQQADRAQAKLKYREAQLAAFFADNGEELDKYYRGLERRDKYRREAARSEVASLRGQTAKISQELEQQLGPWLGTVGAIWKGLESDLNAIATPEQAERGQLSLPKPGRKLMDTVFIDQIIPTFDLVVGACLILGLFTRITSLAGAGFLATIIATQWPGAEGSAPTHYQVVEMFGLLVLAAVGAGQYAGLDYLFNYLRLRCCPPKAETK